VLLVGEVHLVRKAGLGDIAGRDQEQCGKAIVIARGVAGRAIAVVRGKLGGLNRPAVRSRGRIRERSRNATHRGGNTRSHLEGSGHGHTRPRFATPPERRPLRGGGTHFEPGPTPRRTRWLRQYGRGGAVPADGDAPTDEALVSGSNRSSISSRP
jgi:hypothetical protein